MTLKVSQGSDGVMVGWVTSIQKSLAAALGVPKVSKQINKDSVFAQRVNCTVFPIRIQRQFCKLLFVCIMLLVS